MSSISIILASASPRRAALLRDLGVPFEIATGHTAEIEDESIPPAEVATQNALLKARAVAATHPGRVILAADTVVALHRRLFGKPRDLAHAQEMLLALQGQTHEVITGVALLTPDGTSSFADITQVTFRPLTPAQVGDYLARVHVLDKAGAYAIQEHGEMIVESIQGSFSNVVGLPTEKVRVALADLGLLPR